jgi:hypothetical protein
MLIINNHKNETKTGTKKKSLDKETIEYLKNGLDEYLLTSKQGKIIKILLHFQKHLRKDLII